MMQISLRDLMARGVAFSPHEAVAIAQELVRPDARVSPVEQAEALPVEPGPPSLDTVVLRQAGSVACTSCETTPAVFEVAILIEAMLPRDGGVRVPGGLRYALARALLEVDAPPFESVADLSAALARFERGDRASVLRALYARGAGTAVPAGFVERRRTGPTTAALRRDLRTADEALYLQRQGGFPVPEAAAAPPARRTRVNRAAAGTAAAAVLASFAAGYVTLYERHRTPGVSLAHDVDLAAGPVLTASALPFVAPALVAPEPQRERVAVQAPEVLPAARTVAVDDALPAVATSARLDEPEGDEVRSARQTADFRHGDLEVMSVTDAGARSYNARPSPDGRSVAFDSDRAGERAVYIANRSGDGVRRVSGDGPAALPSWSPDGRALAFLRAETDRPHVWNLWTTDLRTGESTRLTSYRVGETGAAAWFPDGQRVCYTHHDTIVVKDLGTGAAREFASPVAGRPARHPAVSPDGGYVLVQIAGSGGWLLDLSDGSMRRVLADPTAEAFAWSADGQRVAYHSRRDDRWGVWITGLPSKG